MDVSVHQRIFSSFVCNQCDGFYETDTRAVFYLSLQVSLLFESRFFVVPVESQMCPTCTEYVCVDRTVGLSSRRKKKFNARRHSCLCLEVSVVCPAVSARCIYIKSTDLISRYTRKIKGCVPVSHNDTTVACDTPRLARGNRALVRPNYRGFITP